jgi:hypothetical protein
MIGVRAVFVLDVFADVGEEVFELKGKSIVTKWKFSIACLRACVNVWDPRTYVKEARSAGLYTCGVADHGE